MNLYMRWGKSGDGKRKEGGFTLKEGEVGRKRAFLVCVCMESGGGGEGFSPSFLPLLSQISYFLKSSQVE